MKIKRLLMIIPLTLLILALFFSAYGATTLGTITINEKTTSVIINGVNYTVIYSPVTITKCLKEETSAFINPDCTKPIKDIKLDDKTSTDVSKTTTLYVDKNMLIKTKNGLYEVIYVPKYITKCICEITQGCLIKSCV
jgi:hypothetical protein